MSLAHNIKAIFLDVTGKQHPAKYHGSEATYVEGKEAGVSTPPSGNEKEISEKTGVDEK